ncbi:FHA domain-containing protein [Fusarium sp. LHS14.1]|nr:FHA domain-containing protein [Fusarium sp. LHS14.1]
MAVPQYRDEVLVTLESIDPPSDFAFPDRRFFLTKEKPTIAIGRTSKRNSTFEAAKNNAWFDSAVMSRTHAELKLDVDKQKVYIKDNGSLHGTFKNEQRLLRGSYSTVTTGDMVKFGIPIERGTERYPPCTMKARLEFGTVDPEDRPKVFSVPDDTDVEYSDSEKDEQVRASYEVLRTMKIFPAAFPASSPSESPIDLTTKDQYPLSNVRDEIDHQVLFSPTTKPDSDVTRTHAHVSVPIPTEDSEYDAPHSPRDPWSLSSVDDINLTQSTDMDTESLPGTESDDESAGFSPVSALVHGMAEDSDDMSERDFEERDEFEEDEYNCEDPLDESDDLEDQEDEEDPEDASHIWEFSQAGSRITVTSSIPSFAKEIQATPLVAPAPEQSQTVNRGAAKPQMDYLLNPFPAAVLPRNLVVHPRLPSISETIPHQPLFSRPYQEGLSGAEMLGLKTGKPEFFAAREANKANSLSMASSSQLPQPRFQTALPVPQSPSLSNPDSRGPPRKHALEEESLRPVPSFSKRKKETHNNDTTEGLQLVDSDLAKSGAEFLNTPPQEPEVPSSTEEPALEASSAYEYSLSKKNNEGAVGSTDAVVTDAPAAIVDAMDGVNGVLDANTADKREQEPLELIQGGNKKTDEKAVPSSDIAEEPAHNVEHAEPKQPEEPHDLPETPQSSKRKADDISQLTPEEEKRAEARLRGERSRRSQLLFRRRFNKMARAEASTPAAAAAPPSKRLRRVAEVVGYAALGGVAVMSALIATAPTL